jgi:hypothetical protein
MIVNTDFALLEQLGHCWCRVEELICTPSMFLITSNHLILLSFLSAVPISG